MRQDRSESNRSYLVEEVSVEASPIMSHDHFLLKFAETYCIECSLHPLHDHWEILAPLDIFLCFGGIGEVDEKKLIVLESVGSIEGFPHLMIIWPPLQKNDYIFAIILSLEEVLQRFNLRHISNPTSN